MWYIFLHVMMWISWLMLLSLCLINLIRGIRVKTVYVRETIIEVQDSIKPTARRSSAG